MSTRPYITCRELIEFLHLYIDGELPLDRRAEFDRHLSVCDSCVHYIETYKTASALARNAWTEPEAPVGEDVPEELVSAILAARRSGV
jgi:anti-sigma factor RsiW